MERRRAVIAAATASLTLLAGAAAVSINSGIVGASGGGGGVGTIEPIDASTPSTVHVDASGAGEARSGGDDGYGVKARDDRSHDLYEHEYEGAQDDD